MLLGKAETRKMEHEENETTLVLESQSSHFLTAEANSKSVLNVNQLIQHFLHFAIADFSSKASYWVSKPS